MQLAKYRSADGTTHVGVVEDGQVVALNMEGSAYQSLAELLDAADPAQEANALRDASQTHALQDVALLAPIDDQEVWAAGVTYKRSKTARMEESEAAASCYDRVYESPRPELFLKATPNRVSGPQQPVRIRVDATWNVPEPEITLVINSRKELVGYTIGNDMSSRDIEGDNPLYLPQAKVYNQCCGLGPVITLAAAMPEREAIGIQLVIRRDGKSVFEGATTVAQMARGFEDLIQWLGRDNDFPAGAFLLTGTGIVPDSDFTLLPADIVDISIDGIGTLSNPVVQG